MTATHIFCSLLAHTVLKYKETKKQMFKKSKQYLFILLCSLYLMFIYNDHADSENDNEHFL